MPRPAVKKSYTSFVGTFPGIKSGGPVRYESTIERDLLYWLEYDLDTHTYKMQPMEIPYTDADGKSRIYYPDCFTVDRVRNKLIECKPETHLNNEHTQRQIWAGQHWAAQNDADFVLVTDKALRNGHTLYNLKLLWKYSRLQVPRPVLLTILNYLASRPVCTYEQLCQEVTSRGRNAHY
jgi:hypothetical protein